MMATFSSFGSLPSRALACSLRKVQDASPNWSECTWARKTFVSFLSLNTAEATQTLAHMKRLAASTFCAIGTQWALENTPMIMSTFSWFSRRSVSLMATSALDWAST